MEDSLLSNNIVADSRTNV